MKFADMVTNSVLLRFLASLILFLTMLLALAIAAYDLIVNHPIPPEILTIVGTGLGAAFAILGINYGVILQPAKNGGASGTP